MGAKKESKIKRMEAAQEFARLSGQVADGFIELGSTRAELPDEFFLKRSLKVKKGEISFELSLKVKASRDNKAVTKKGETGDRPRQKKRPYKAKRLKKDIGMMWKALKRCIRTGETFRDVEGFLKALETYGQGAEQEWSAQWEECVQAVKEAIELSDQGRKEEALGICEQVDSLTKACHKKFK